MVKPSHLNEYVQTFNVAQLRWDRKTNVLPDMAVMNFGEAKGETFDRVLIYPTKDMAKWVEDTSTQLSDGARAKFYVALTRARYSAAIVTDCDDGFESDCLSKYDPRDAA